MCIDIGVKNLFRYSDLPISQSTKGSAVYGNVSEYLLHDIYVMSYMQYFITSNLLDGQTIWRADFFLTNP